MKELQVINRINPLALSIAVPFTGVAIRRLMKSLGDTYALFTGERITKLAEFSKTSSGLLRGSYGIEHFVCGCRKRMVGKGIAQGDCAMLGKTGRRGGF